MTSTPLKLAMLAAGLATFALLYATQPLLPQFAQHFGLSATQASLAVSLTTGPLAFGIVVGGIVSDGVGRRGVMIASLLIASLLTCLSALVASWPLLLASRLVIGLALAGLPSVAMAYVAEEAAPGTITAVMGLYVAGTSIGGMTGRVGGAMVAARWGWQAGLAAVGGAGLVMAVVFMGLAPASRGFVRRRHDLGSIAAALGRLGSDATMPLLYLEAFLLMGAFVTLYNFAGFHLLAPPFRLSHAEVGALFLIYIVGTGSSAWFGRIASRAGAATVLPVPFALFLAGIALTLVPVLPVFVLGLALATGGFFGAHVIASSWVSRAAGGDRGIAASLYLFFYYMGSSVLGSLGGVAWERAGWAGVAGYAGGLIALGLAVAIGLRKVTMDPRQG